MINTINGFYDTFENHSNLTLTRLTELMRGKFTTVSELNQAFRDFKDASYGLRLFCMEEDIDVPAPLPVSGEPPTPEELEWSALTAAVAHRTIYLRNAYAHILGQLFLREALITPVNNIKVPRPTAC